MKTILKFATGVLLLTTVFFVTCTKHDQPSPNRPPVANAGGDILIILPIDSVTLDGSSSTDPDGKIVDWLWSKISGPPSFKMNNETAKKTVVKNLVEGYYQFELKVKDEGGLSAEDTIEIFVINSANRLPLANAGPDVALMISSCSSSGSADLDGSGSSDPDNNVIYYQWTKISGPPLSTISNYTSPKAKAENLSAGQYVFELAVTDSKGGVSKDTMLVNVSANSGYNLDIAFDAGFTFQDNYKYCYYDCSYYDLTTAEGKFSLPEIGGFTFQIDEWADTATSSDVHETNLRLYTTGTGPNAWGTCSINFKQLIQKGGGSFNGIFKVQGGSASACNPNVFDNLDPLAVTGDLDTTTHTIRVSMKGKIYF